jgi:hypothetical protein
VSQMNNKSAYGIFSSIKVTLKSYREKIEPNLQPMIIIGMAVCGLAFCAMDVKGNTKEVI